MTEWNVDEAALAGWTSSETGYVVEELQSPLFDFWIDMTRARFSAEPQNNWKAFLERSLRDLVVDGLHTWEVPFSNGLVRCALERIDWHELAERVPCSIE